MSTFNLLNCTIPKNTVNKPVLVPDKSEPVLWCFKRDCHHYICKYNYRHYCEIGGYAKLVNLYETDKCVIKTKN